MELTDSIQYLKGVGPALARKFERLEIRALEDLICHYPRRYVDFTQCHPVAYAPFGEDCVVRVRIHSKLGCTRLSGGRTLYRALAADDSGAVSLSWFNAPYTYDGLQVGQEYYFVGRVGGTLTRREMISPAARRPQQVSDSPLAPVYPQTEGLSSTVIARCVGQALDGLGPLEEDLPQAILKKYRLPGRDEAVRAIHRPLSAQQAAGARRRLMFEELFILQCGVLLMRDRGSRLTGAPMQPRDLAPFWSALPFPPTGAQERAAGEISADLAGPAPMNRLLQGDVGSGKTLVAAAGVWQAAQNGYQSALMAPTEILAVQHADNLQDLLGPLGIRVALLTGSTKGAERRKTLEAIAGGQADLVVGTHALLSQGVEFARLGLAVVDEQHRFGVRQRGLLAAKAQSPHLLVMSATPIPRTLALLLYGDLDISLLDELPPGRNPVKTWLISGKKRADMFGFLAAQIRQGRQVYIVCPLIEENAESPAGEKQAAREYLEKIARPGLPGCRLGLLHGRMKPAEKAKVMDEFKAGELDALISTTVIEVGVDVPNATVMVIENAERYGLSALHQLRGRVGRGSQQSCCILISDHEEAAVRDRLRFLCHTSDGFAIARYDLEHRGPGDFFGQAQHGLPSLKLASLADSGALTAAQQEARALLKEDPALRLEIHQPLAHRVEKLFEASGPMN